MVTVGPLFQISPKTKGGLQLRSSETMEKKVACVAVLMCMVVAAPHAKAAISCSQVVSSPLKIGSVG
ncbi:hypothetical protein RHMOL_Rhmol05G0306000 [Rhododendron molle]|uniref:Uncharacterized protein n=1 Tax=Rhododendron molle TaxID=49168 RepID=A0ACC0NVQ2_RHOML|nr:hypothetical protein RHMOL_Rhmol05G0306000 [Rhododendron molle]